MAGVVGLKKPRYDIFGETVNIAKQLEETGTGMVIKTEDVCLLFRSFNIRTLTELSCRSIFAQFVSLCEKQILASATGI